MGLGQKREKKSTATRPGKKTQLNNPEAKKTQLNNPEKKTHQPVGQEKKTQREFSARPPDH